MSVQAQRHRQSSGIDATPASSSTSLANESASPERIVAAVVARARAAQREYARADQATVDAAVAAAAWAIMAPARNRQLAERAVADTGLGNVDDKFRKNHRKTLGLLRDLHGLKTVGVINVDAASGITEIARPVGVVAAITPSTNPAATPANKIINALKGGNAVIVAPSPKGQGACELLLSFIHAELAKVGVPADLVQMLPAPVSKATTSELMRQADLVVATGSQANVRMAYTSGTPAFGVGAGNVASIIDASAALDDAAAKIARSKTFDNATSCSSENSVVILDAVYSAMLAALAAHGGVLLTAGEKAQLQDVMWQGGKLSGRVTGQDARRIAELAGLERVSALQPTMLLVEEDGVGADFPFSGEKLSPVLTVYRARDFAAAMARVEQIYDYMGAGHSVSLHSADAGQALQLGLQLPVARVIVNQAHCLATGGNFDNGLPFSLSMGCGTWGGNNFSENLGWRQYINITRIATPIAEQVPSEAALLGDYFARYGK
ncbi:sulfoacetaldehyde dehydrogenase [Pandoraea terrae]|uniref:Sulfoacetaldehyde dehydrogenase n=1 Tax=Pandoraea terrae TaxID=1537710 RepID=A0A5E4X6A7_9BURK|nr:aldehyde dehydrogenase family protein [Pandoraea terrae]VVE31877.1 sulfoacetaldehyde dehydrogenase [Pandoraea terrae]